jgi:transposase
MHAIGEDAAERLDLIPAQFRVIVTHRPKYARLLRTVRSYSIVKRR